MVLGKISVAIVFLGMGATLFSYYAMKECENFTIPDQTGKVMIVTGGNSGLGYETVKSLAVAGAHVILASRSISKGDAAKAEILKFRQDALIDVMELDLSSFQSIRAFAKAVAEKYSKVDVLINNAGVMAIPNRELTVDGLEMQIGTNHFGHFLLTSLIFPLLSQNGRVVNHASGAYRFAASNFPADDIQSARNYSPWVSYGNSKISNLLFTYELNRRLEAFGNPKNIQSFAVHPGYSATNLQTERFPFYELLNRLFAMKAEHGAQSQIIAAVGLGVGTSQQFGTMIGPKYNAFGAPALESVDSNAYSDIAMKTLWDESNKITKSNFLAG